MSAESLAPARHDTLDGIPDPAESVRLFGHSEAVAQVADAYREGRLHHALLLAGPQGIGKATFAYHLARHLLAHPEPREAPASFQPADASSALFRQVASGVHPSVLHLTRPYNDKTKKFATLITVDEIRKVAKFLSMRTHDGSYRIVIVDSADDMNRNAANALLKNLEEPPGRVLFILISHAQGGLLPTIRSRCQTVRMSPLAEQDMDDALTAAGIKLPDDPQARERLTARAGGSARQAILLAEYGGLELAEAADRFLGASRRDPLDAYKLADAVTGREREVQFELLNRHILDRLAEAATAAAESGDIRRAGRLAAAWDAASQALATADEYNLDKREHVIGQLNRVAAELGG